MTDEEVPIFWRGLGLPGLVDLHVHFYPERMLHKVWKYFDNVFWKISYRGTDEQRRIHLKEMGVRAYPALSYAHKPGMAADLNDWALAFAATDEACLPSATFYPEPGVLAYVEKALTAGVRVFKVHVQVGAFDPRDELLDEVWGLLAETGTPIVAHTGSGPLPGDHTGPGPFAEVLRRHPRLAAVIAHMGTPDYAEFLALAEKYERVRLDTTMAFTDFVEGFAPYPANLLERVKDLGLAGKVVLGTDYPNIPYPYAHQLEALVRLDFGDDWLRAVCWHNGWELLGAQPVAQAL
jgi:predicted TIM-barrel fold metal-dependent hydrolase